MLIVHNFGNSDETIDIAGPTTVELKVAVRVVFLPSQLGDTVQADVSWELQSGVSTVANYQWVRTTGTCSVTCGAGGYLGGQS